MGLLLDKLLCVVIKRRLETNKDASRQFFTCTGAVYRYVPGYVTYSNLSLNDLVTVER